MAGPPTTAELAARLSPRQLAAHQLMAMNPEALVSQQFLDTGYLGAPIRVVNPSAAIYVVQTRVKIFTDGNFVVQFHDLATTPTSATGRVLSFRVTGSATGVFGAADPNLFPGDIPGGWGFANGCWVTIHKNIWSASTTWSPADALLCEIETWHAPLVA